MNLKRMVKEGDRVIIKPYGDDNRGERRVGEIFTIGNTKKKSLCVNMKQLEDGMAWYSEQKDIMGDSSTMSLCNQYILVMENAKAGKKGIWSQSDPEQPAVYRKRILESIAKRTSEKRDQI